MRVPWLLLAAACTGAQTKPNTFPAETAVPQTTIPATLELNGTRPEHNLAAPEFSQVTNRDGSARSKADLVGHPTVLWFYPAANTGG